MAIPRFRIRTLMIAVAALCVLLGGGLEYRRLSRLSAIYRYQAWGFGENVRMRHTDLLKAKQQYLKLTTDPSADPKELERLALTMRGLRASIAANANIAQMYERAASHPWEAAPAITEATESAEDFPVPKQLIANPPPPAPYRPF